MKRVLACLIASAVVATLGLSIYWANKELDLLDEAEGEVTPAP